MPEVRIEVITMEGNAFVLWDNAGLRFPHGDLDKDEAPADAVRRLVKAWSGTDDPKIELVDMLHGEGVLTLLFRAMLLDAPQGEPQAVARGMLAGDVCSFDGPTVEKALQTGLNYKLTRRG